MRAIGEFSPFEVDRMEIWQVAATIWYAPRAGAPASSIAAPAARSGPGPRRIDDRALIHARVRAAKAGQPEPFHLFGVPAVR